MNSKNSTCEIDVKKYNITRDFYFFIGEAFGYYIIPILSGFSFLVNVSFLSLLAKNKKLVMQRKYRMLMIKSSIISIVGKYLLDLKIIHLKKGVYNHLRFTRNGISKLALHILRRKNLKHVCLSDMECLFHPDRRPCNSLLDRDNRNYHQY